MGLLGLLGVSGHRLSLTTALPVTIADVTAAATIYMTPDVSSVIGLYNGTGWAVYAQAELSLALSSNSGHTGYHQSGKNFDLFYFDDSGTKRLGSSPAWTNDTTRADAIARVNGVWVNNASIVLRFGSSAGNTVTIASNKATYLGTFRASADGQTEDSFAKRFLWNRYNRRPRVMRVLSTTDSYTYTTDAWREAEGGTSNRLQFVRGLDEDAVRAVCAAQATNSATDERAVLAAIGVDSTTAFAVGCIPGIGAASSTQVGNPVSTYDGMPGIGFHYLSNLERASGADTQTFYQDAGTPTKYQQGITGTIFA